MPRRARRRAGKLLGSLVWLLALGCDTAAPHERWVPVVREDLVSSVEVQGSLAAVDSDTLGPPLVGDVWEFKISSMVPEGASVNEGDTVLTFDTSELERQLISQRNERDAAAAELARELSNERLTRQNEALRIAESEAKLRKVMLKVQRPADLTGSLELAAAQLDLELAQKELTHLQRRAEETRRQAAGDAQALTARRQHAEERVRRIERNIPRLTLKSPRSGTVIYVAAGNRPKKKVGDAVWWGEKLLEIAALEHMTARAEIDEVDVSRVAVGQRVTLRLEAHADTEHTGTVKTLGSIVERRGPDNPLRVVRLVIELDPTEGHRLRPGMRFRGSIEAARIPELLLMPMDAVSLTDGAPVARVRTATGDHLARLTLGRRNQSQVEVLSGVSEGDRVARQDFALTESEKP
jgi:multidrug efflux pump subunit AcrA (membrane-fusion protein)